MNVSIKIEKKILSRLEIHIINYRTFLIQYYIVFTNSRKIRPLVNLTYDKGRKHINKYNIESKTSMLIYYL